MAARIRSLSTLLTGIFLVAQTHATWLNSPIYRIRPLAEAADSIHMRAHFKDGIQRLTTQCELMLETHEAHLFGKKETVLSLHVKTTLTDDQGRVSDSFKSWGLYYMDRFDRLKIATPVPADHRFAITTSSIDLEDDSMKVHCDWGSTSSDWQEFVQKNQIPERP